LSLNEVPVNSVSDFGNYEMKISIR